MQNIIKVSEFAHAENEMLKALQFEGECSGCWVKDVVNHPKAS